MKVRDNTILINDKQIMFDFNIRTVIETSEYCIVLLAIPFNEQSIDNIYAISLLSGEIVWRVEQCKKWLNPLPYENMHKVDDYHLSASDFYARGVIVDLRTGKILDTKISK